MAAHANPYGDPVICEDSWEAIIDRKTFDRAQQRLVERSKLNTPHSNGGPYVLSGLLFCGHCGSNMVGKRNATKNGRYPYHRYQCNRYAKGGPGACVRNPIDADAVVSYLANIVTERVLSEDSQERLRSELRRQLGKTVAPAAVLDRLTSKASKLDQGIARAADRVLGSPDDLVDVLSDRLRCLKLERQDVAEQISKHRAVSATAPRDIDQIVERAMETLHEQREKLLSGESPKVRQVFRETIERVDIWCETVRAKSSVRYRFERGEVQLKGNVLSRQVSRD